MDPDASLRDVTGALDAAGVEPGGTPPPATPVYEQRTESAEVTAGSEFPDLIAHVVEAGDRVTLCRIDEPDRHHTFIVSASRHDPAAGVLGAGDREAESIIGACVGEEISLSLPGASAASGDSMIVDIDKGTA